jgi:hypothetical protein
MVYRLSLGGEEDAEQVLRGPLAETGATVGLYWLTVRFLRYLNNPFSSTLDRRILRRTTTDSGRD